MGFFNNKNGAIISEWFKLIEGIENMLPNFMCEVMLYDNHLIIKQGKKTTAELQYNQITDVFYGLKTEIIQKKQSTIGRAMVGGILFGGPGAIVGAISAGKKEKKKTNLYFIISYTSSSGEEKYINFEVSGGGFNGRKLADKLRELCNIKDIKREDEIKL